MDNGPKSRKSGPHHKNQKTTPLEATQNTTLHLKARINGRLFYMTMSESVENSWASPRNSGPPRFTCNPENRSTYSKVQLFEKMRSNHADSCWDPLAIRNRSHRIP